MQKTFREALSKGITPSQRRSRVLSQVLAEIMRGKPSFHSSMGSTVCALMHGLEEAGMPYVLLARPGQGYSIQIAPAEKGVAPLTATSE